MLLIDFLKLLVIMSGMSKHTRKATIKAINKYLLIKITVS